MKLTVKGVEKLVRDRVEGTHGDDESRGLYLRISATGAASWQFRYQMAGRRRGMGLGSVEQVGLADARARAAELRELVRTGKDPLEVPKQARAPTTAPTFADCARDYIAAHGPGWKNAKHRAQWQSTLQTYALPTIGDKLPAAVTTTDVVAVLQPIWTAKPETANRVRNRIELVWDSARARGLCSGQNPAAWKGHLDKLLPPRVRASRGHFAAMPYADVPAFAAVLKGRADTGARALLFAILTACRSGEVRGATWRELDLAAGVWTIPASRMKSHREHRVPLTAAMVEVLRAAMPKDPAPDEYVFPGAKAGRPLSDMTLTALLRRENMGVTAHGFRSSFRDWAAEETHHAHAVAEMALAHAIGNAVEAAYRRGDLLEKRRALMQDWSDYVMQKT